ncbi:MAG: D-alanyl-D-alanine carboxypeptidase family protein [Angustibacter sp.]
MPSAFSTDDRIRTEGLSAPEYRGRRRREPAAPAVSTAPASATERSTTERSSTEPTLPLPVPELAAAVSVLPQQPAPATARYLTRAEAKAAARAEERAARSKARTTRTPQPSRPTPTPAAPSTRSLPATGPLTQLRTPLRQRAVAVDANARRAPQRRDQPAARPGPRHRGLAAVAAVAAVGALGAVASAVGALPSAASDQAGAALGPQAAAAVGVVDSRGQRSTEQSAARTSDLGDSAFRMVAVSRSQERGPIAGCSGREPGEHYANGQLPSSILCALPFAPGHKLRADAAVRLIRLNEVYKGRFGSDLCLTDSYRSLASQYSVAARKPGLAARPGTSEHGWGLAIDVCGGPDQVGSTRRAWFLENAPAFGWDNPDWARPGGSKPEPWHWEFVEGE